MKKILICNQKMFLTPDESVSLKKDLDNMDLDGVDFIICPNYLDLDLFSDYNVGAQDCFYEDKGAFTGEVSAYQLHLKGVEYSIVGHLERRKYETLKEINLKVKACLRNSITPIICIGESKLDRDMKRVSETLKKQLISIFDKVSISDNQKVIISYEPLWAIGSKKTIDKKELKDTILFIKKVISTLNISNYNIIYGGGISKDTILNIHTDDIDGYLLGSASCDIDELKSIIKCIK